MKRFVLRWILAGFLIGTLLAPISVCADDAGPSEYQVKAAFLFNFAKFIKWPESAFPETNSPVVVGIYGEDPFGSSLAVAIKDKTINGHPLIIRPVASLPELKQCHVVFICSKPKRNVADTTATLRNMSILTVSETDGFIENGGMINFYSEGTKVRFEINDKAAAEAGLTVSSKLLSVAGRKGGKE